MADAPLLVVHQLKRSVGGRTLWSNISFEVFPGEIWFLRGPSGVGKTLLLRAVACLDPLEAGWLKLSGQSPSEVGIPCWRAQVMYVHQSRVNFKGTPQEFFTLAQSFAAQKGRPRGDLAQLVADLGLDAGVLQQQWSELSGGQAQRVALAVSLALQPKLLLLDEPTSACDTEAALKVEAVLKRCSAAVLWVTHDPQQPLRVGGRLLELPEGNASSIHPQQQQQQQQQPGLSEQSAASQADGSAHGKDTVTPQGSSSSSRRVDLAAASAAGQGESGPTA
ncbi:hypothetical protein OEZ85_004701 [Tetradesmus obliquus]|uniref:ABC transporter domain-containing protein n=1 Tax=Tetradesmus obliquus TaxID=3088 RepID=A0ABY8UM75_TETOB|nr:hypothetical protein OEZ85_004701 [Tetradesmus obliquus]